MKKLIKNEYIFSIITKGLMVLIGLLESVLLARYLGADLRGELSYIHSVAATGYLIITFGIYTVYPFERKKSVGREEVTELINTFMIQAITLFLIYFLISLAVFFIAFSRNLIVSYIVILLPLMGFDKIVTFVYLIEHPNKANLFEVLSNCIQCIFLGFSYIFFTKQLYIGVLYYALGCLIRIVYYYQKLGVQYNYKKFDFKLLREYVEFGFFPMIALLLTTLNYRLDVIMLRQYSSISLASIGVYSIGIGLSEKALLIPDTIKSVLISKLAKGKGPDEVAKVMRICFLASIITAVVIMILGKMVISVLYGSEYCGAEQITYVTVWGTTVMVFFKMISQYNVVEHKQYLNVAFLSIAIGLNLLFNFILIPSQGILGAAIATIIGHLVSSFVFLLYFHRTTNIPLKQLVFIQKDDIHALKRLF